MELPKASNKGFTIVELIIVIFILGVLAAVGIPNYLFARDKARIAAAKEDLNAIVKGINMYYVDRGTYPAETTLDNVGSITILQEELANPNNHLTKFYDDKIQEYKSPPVTSGETSPFEILVRTKAGTNREGKVCWLYYSENRELTEVWVSP